MSNVYDSNYHNEMRCWEIFHKCGIKPEEEKERMKEAIVKISAMIVEASEAGFADAKQAYEGLNE